MCTLNKRVCSTRQKGGVRCGSVRAPGVDPAEVLGSLTPPQSKSWCEGKSRCCCGPSAREAVPGAGMWKRAHARHPLRVLLGGIGGWRCARGCEGCIWGTLMQQNAAGASFLQEVTPADQSHHPSAPESQQAAGTSRISGVSGRCQLGGNIRQIAGVKRTPKRKQSFGCTSMPVLVLWRVSVH